MRSMSLVFWYDCGWFDQARKQFVLVGRGADADGKTTAKYFRSIDLESGRVEEGSWDLVSRVLSEDNIDGLDQALRLAAEDGLASAKSDLVRYFSDARRSSRLRLTAAVALGRLGERRGAMMLTDAATNKGPNQEYALGDLPVVLGDDAARWLCQIGPGLDEYHRSVARGAMTTIRPAVAVPALLELLKARGTGGRTTFSLRCLEDVGRAAAPAVPELIKLLEEDKADSHPQSVLKRAASVLGRVGPEAKAALPVLREIVAHRSSKEWTKLVGSPRLPRRNLFGELTYSDDAYVDAICKIDGN